MTPEEQLAIKRKLCQEQAKKDYEEFFRLNPDQQNPTDINTKEKFEFMIGIGWQRLWEMRKARKVGKPFTKRKKK